MKCRFYPLKLIKINSQALTGADVVTWPRENPWKIRGRGECLAAAHHEGEHHRSDIILKTIINV